MSQGQILVIRGGAIGDFILTLPAITAIRKQFSNAHLEVLGYPHIAKLALAAGIVDAVQPIESQALAGFFANGGNLAERWCDYFSEFDIIVSYLYDPDEVFRDNVARCSPAQFIQAPHRAADRDKVHATKVYLKPLERLAIFDVDEVPRLSINSQPSIPNHLALHPGSGSETKNWPELKWRELISHLIKESSANLMIVGGEAEGDRLERLAGLLPKDRFTLARSLPLVELATCMQRCFGFIGHDSGITHLAASLGLPCLVLWGDTAEEVWRPRGEKLVVLRNSDGLDALSVDLVIKQLNDFLRIA